MSTINPISQNTILDLVYPKSEIFIQIAEFASTEASVMVNCFISKDNYYTVKPIPYVTTENYVRCLSQATYLLVEHTLLEHKANIETNVEVFRTAAASFEIYYRNLSMVFHERVARGEAFVLLLSIKSACEINRLGKDFVLFTFTNKKTVISGEMSFVLKR